jgi:hypothetical protein
MQLDQSNNLKTLYATPAWPTPAFCSAFSALGTATILRLDADKGYAPELVRWNFDVIASAWGSRTLGTPVIAKNFSPRWPPLTP